MSDTPLTPALGAAAYRSATVGIGHNAGTVPTPEEIQEILRADYEDAAARFNALMDGVARAPAAINDDETEGRLADFVAKQLRPHLKLIKDSHTEKKAPYLAGGRAVDGFFFPMRDRLDAAIVDLQNRGGAYQRRKVDEERKRREEAENKAREEAAAAAKAAEEAAAAMQEDTDLDAAIAAEEAAAAAAAAAEEAARAAQAKTADLSRVRGDFGAVGSLREPWTGEMSDRAKLNLEALREHLTADALNQAIRSFVKAGGRKLDGALIKQKHSAQYR